ncbi:MAG: NAD(P)H-binding protein [Gemmatimonas sp.]|nr:NAD(P)H-binding protein [Gemmatimonas sp.]
MNVLVTGATGKQGGATARALLSNGQRVRAMTRNRESPAAVALASAGAEVVVGDFRDRDALIAAMEGVEALFAMTTFFEEGVAAEVEQGKTLVDAARAAGLAHVVQTSVASADRQTGIPHFDSKYEVEQYLAASGLPYTVIAPVAFMENMLIPPVLDGVRQGVYAAPLPADRKLQQIAVDDLGRFAVLVIERRESMLGKRIELASDELNGSEQASILSEVLGREIRYQELPLDVVRQQSEEVAVMYEWFDRVGYDSDIAELRQLYPDVGWHTFADWARQQDWSSLDAR